MVSLCVCRLILVVGVDGGCKWEKREPGGDAGGKDPFLVKPSRAKPWGSVCLLRGPTGTFGAGDVMAESLYGVLLVRWMSNKKKIKLWDYRGAVVEDQQPFGRDGRDKECIATQAVPRVKPAPGLTK